MSPDDERRPACRSDGGIDGTSATTLAQQQAMFAAHLRDPQHHAAPPVAEERIAVYRELFFNNVRDLLAGNFPVLRRLLGRERWERLIRQFYRDHRSATPLFPELGREFLDWLAQQEAEMSEEAASASDDAFPSRGTSIAGKPAPTTAPDGDTATSAGWPAFMLELAHYEWIELALALDETDLSQLAFDPHGDLLHGTPLVSPLAWPLAYRFPVHRIGPDFQPEATPDTPTFLLIRRDAQHAIHFHEIDALGHALLLALHDNCGAASGLALIEQLIADQPDAATMRQQAHERLTSLHRRGAILGTVHLP
ncbi:MAG: putative DNA-binding domain-containing protein [Lysobacteraceae bacterium]